MIAFRHFILGTIFSLVALCMSIFGNFETMVLGAVALPTFGISVAGIVFGYKDEMSRHKVIGIVGNGIYLLLVLLIFMNAT